MDRNYKLIYKLYQPDGTFIKTLNQEEIISDFQITKNINGGVSNLAVTLKKPIDNYDEYDAVKNPTGSIKYGNRIKVYLTDLYNTTPKQIYYGYLVEISPSYQNGEESVELTFYGAVSKLSNDYYNTSGTPPYEPTEPAGFYVEESAISASAIIKNILDNYLLIATYPMVSYTWGGSIVDCGNLVSYTFDRSSHLDAAKKIEEYLPVGWFWYVDETGVMNVKDSALQTEHKLTIGRHIKEIQAHKSIESIINYFVLWNGRSTADASYVFAYQKDATSQTDYGRVTLFQQDSEVLEDSVATIRKNKVIAYRKDPKQELTIEVSGEHYDVSLFQPGQLVSIRNIRNDVQTTFADGLVIKRVSYKINSVLLELGEAGADLASATSDESTAVELSIKQAQSATENIQSGSTPITEANIQYLAGDFIKEDVIYSPIIAGINGYFRDSLTMGQSGIGSVIKSYGKTGYNNGSLGYWLEKSALNYTYFELYGDVDNYIRYNSLTRKVEIAGDIILGPGTTITWSQISDALVPNTPDLSSFNNNLGWTTDASVIALANGTYASGTFISNKFIYSPIIAGASGYFRDSITVGGSGIGGIIKSYGKGSYADSVAGFYLERNSGGRVMFELYKSASDYFRYDSSASPAIQFRGGLNADDIITGTLAAARMQTNVLAALQAVISNLSAIKANLGTITAGTISGVTIDVSSDININVGATNVLRLNSNAFIARQNKAFAAEGSTAGQYTQFYTTGANGMMQITNNASGTFGIINNNGVNFYLMKWSNYDIEMWRTLLPMVSGIDLGSSAYKFDDVYCNTMKGLYGEIYLDQVGRIQVTNHLDPSGAGSYNLGGDTRYWNGIYYKNLYDKGCLGWFDEGVELRDGRVVSDTEAIKEIKKHPTKKTNYGVDMLDYSSFPKVAYNPAKDDSGKLCLRDEDNEPYFEEIDPKTKKKVKVKTVDSVEMTSVFSIMIGAIKELTLRIEKLEKSK